MLTEFGWFEKISCLDELNFCSSDKIRLPEWTKTFDWAVLLHWEKKKYYWIKSISVQKHVYHRFKSICYRISNIFIGLVVHFYELIVCMLLERNAFDSIAFYSQCDFIKNFVFCSCYKLIQFHSPNKFVFVGSTKWFDSIKHMFDGIKKNCVG